MGIGRSFIEAFVKAKRGLEGDFYWQPQGLHPWFRHELAGLAAEEERQRALTPVYLADRFRRGRSRSTVELLLRDLGGEQDEGAPLGERERVVILGFVLNRIGQGVEFDYCWCTWSRPTASSVTRP